jgi:molecular chaperone DnaJ
VQDLYQALGVSKNADAAEIKKAFKSLARKYHPDVNKEAGAESRFKEISAAYEVLGDEQKRALYDEFGEESLHVGFNADRARAYKNMGRNGFGGGNPFGGGGFGGVNLDELLGGGMGSFFGGGRAGPARGADLEGNARIPFMVAVRGGEIPLSVRRPTHCGVCQGEGGTGKKACSRCGGKGRRSMGQFVVACEACGGTGSEFAAECGACGGTGRVHGVEDLKVRIPAGAESGRSIRLKAKGAEGVRGGPPGDLIVTLEVADHPLLKREGNDLELEVPISLSEALAGASVEVPTPTTPVRIKLPPGSGNGTRLRIPGRGIQLKEGAGDLYLILRPVLPPSSPEAIELAEKLDALRTGELRSKLSL